MVLAVDRRVGRARRAASWYALNEAVLEKVHTGRLVRLEVEINGAPSRPTPPTA